jgi:hypothetical protein
LTNLAGIERTTLKFFAFFPAKSKLHLFIRMDELILFGCPLERAGNKEFHMKKSFVFLLGLLVLATGLTLTGCASLIVFDNTVPAENSAIIHMHDGCIIQTIDGKGVSGFTIGSVASETKGKGSDKYTLTRNPRVSTARIQVPAGERTIFGSVGGSRSSYTVVFNFVAGRHYEMIMVIDQEQAGRQIGGAMLGNGYNFTFVDVTDQVR